MKYRAEIDGLRALAVIPVILFHAGFSAFSGGFVGVDVFFVISGYLITTIIINELDAGKFSLVKFYERRARRILPALFFVLLICLPFAYLWLLPRHMHNFSASLISTVTFCSNVFFWRESGYFGPAAETMPLLHMWSLAIEEQFYLFFPLFLMFTWFLGRKKILAALILVFLFSLVLSYLGTQKYQTAAFFLLPTRFWELLVGSFAAFYLTRGRKSRIISFDQIGSILGLLLILFAILFFDEDTPFPSLYAIIPTMGTALIIVFATQKTLVSKLLSLKPFVFMGLISYSAYLWHQPILVFARHRSVVSLTLETSLALILLSMILAYVSWRYVEKPFRDRTFLNSHKIFLFSFIGLSSFAAVGAFGLSNDGLSGRLSSRALEITNENPHWADVNECALNGPDEKGSMADCFVPNNTLYLIGDSHAASLSKPIRDMAEKNGWNLISWTSSGCLPIKGISRMPLNQHSICTKYKKEVFNFIETYPAPVVMSSRWRLNLNGNRFDNLQGGREHGADLKVAVIENPDAQLSAHIINEIEKLSRQVPVILIDQIPEAGWHVHNYRIKREFFNLVDEEKLATSYAAYRDANSDVIKMLNSLESIAAIIETAPLVCDASTNLCLNEMNGQSLYRDDNHPSELFANLITQRLEKYLKSMGILTSKGTEN